MLWLATEITSGIVGQIWAFAWTEAGRFDDRFLWLAELESLAVAGLVLYFVWPDRQARRIFVRPRPRMVELCLLAGVAASLLLSMWERQIPLPPDSHPLTTTTLGMEFVCGWPMWACLLSSAVAPAVFEELMYRGLLLHRFLRVMPAGLAIAVQAMLFSVTHLDTAFLLPHFAFGMVAGLLRMAAGALWPCMLMHFLWNGSIVLRLYEWL
jgi:membrane protease YdiL (CAAX protease family)